MTRWVSRGGESDRMDLSNDQTILRKEPGS